MEANDAERQIAELKKQLEAAQAPASIAGWGGLFSLVGSVVALVPRWLVVAAGVIFIGWLGFDLYVNVRVKMAEVERIEAESRAAATTFKNPLLAPSPASGGADTPAEQAEIARLNKEMGRDPATGKTLQGNAQPGETFLQRLQRIKAERDAAAAAYAAGTVTKEQCEKLKARGWTDLSGCEKFGVTP